MMSPSTSAAAGAAASGGAATRRRGPAALACLAALLALGACSALPDKPTRPAMYDFGPGATAPLPQTREAPLPPLAIDDITTSGGAIDNMSVLYRLAYADSQQLRPYSQARWSMPPAQLVRQRLREQLGQRRAIFNAGEGVALNRSQNAVLPLLLKLQLEEFSHIFTTEQASAGVIRLRATLVEVTPSGEKLLSQRNVIVQKSAPTPDAPGGVRAMAEATDAAIADIDQWLQQNQALVAAPVVAPRATLPVPAPIPVR